MDNSHTRRTSSPPRLPSNPSIQAFSDVSDVTLAQDVFQTETSPSRQQRLLNNRHARFPAKKLSITSLGNKLSQLVSNNEKPDAKDTASKGQENSKLHKSRSTGTIGKRSSLKVLEEISSIGRSYSARRREDIPIYQDHADQPLLQSSPFVSSPYIDPRGASNSPLGFDHIQDTLTDMRLRELPLNVDWSPAAKSPTLHSKRRKRSIHGQFDTDDYIEHIEKELQQTRDEAYSPLTRRPMKEKLRAANKENERLQRELTTLREKFETEVKRTVEHKTVAELELKRKVKDLEDSIEEKDHTIRELQYQHEEIRLDNNMITSLKATIERLEQDKLDMEEINLGMNQRNELLSKLLAMSPAKACDGFDLKSPVRERRNKRPISLILPRTSSSPNGSTYDRQRSIVYSPRALNSADISPLRLSPDQELSLQAARLLHKEIVTPQHELTNPMERLPSPVHQTKSRRSTLQSDISASSSGANGIASFLNEEKGLTRRKARRFMAGSTQLKPLLLPSLAGESISLLSASTVSSPRSWSARAPSEIDADDTILPNGELPSTIYDQPNLSRADSTLLPSHEAGVEEGPGPAYTEHKEPQLLDLTAQSTPHRQSEDENSDVDPKFSSIEPFAVDPPVMPSSGIELSVEHLKQHNSNYSLQMMPVPETPESLVAPPRPLFSMNRNVVSGTDLTTCPSGSPLVPSEGSWQVNISKKRKHSLGMIDHTSPSPKVHRRDQSQDVSTSEASRPQVSGAPRSPPTCASSSSAKHRLSQIRSTDNFADLLRQKNFAARPLAALTIKTIYTLLSTCTNAVREFRSDPFALARRVLANAWRMNWKVFGKVSWWVLGLFIQPEARSKARASIDWDQYDGESIASRYCNSVPDEGDSDSADIELEQRNTAKAARNFKDENGNRATGTDAKPGWGQSMYLWGKFSAALVLAIGGVVVKGPSEMLKDAKTPPRSDRKRHKHCKGCNRREKLHRNSHPQLKTSSPQAVLRSGVSEPYLAIEGTHNGRSVSEFDFRFELDSSSFLEQIQQPDNDSTLRPETSRRGRLGSLFSPTPSSGGLVSRMQDLRLFSVNSRVGASETDDPGLHGCHAA